jgi:hypothetical protein
VDSSYLICLSIIFKGLTLPITSLIGISLHINGEKGSSPSYLDDLMFLLISLLRYFNCLVLTKTVPFILAVIFSSRIGSSMTSTIENFPV